MKFRIVVSTRCVASAVFALVTTATASAQDGRRIIEVGGVLVSGSEQGAYEGVPYEANASYVGVWGGVRGGPFFLRGQYLKATLSETAEMPQREVRAYEAGAGLFFVPEFRLDGAAFAREYQSVRGRQRWVGVKFGAGFQGVLWPGLVEARAVGHYIPLIRSSVEEDKATLGWDGEVEVALRHRRIPARFGIGYRVERLDSARPPSRETVRKQRFSGLVFRLALSL